MRTAAPLSVLLLPILLLQGQPARAQQPPPHAFLFGNWVGGVYPVLSTQVEQACHSDVTLSVRGDAVTRVVLATGAAETRVIATARPVTGGVDLTFAPQAGAAGFGCETPDVLHVRRSGQDEVTFPGCSDYPEPLVKCR